MDRTNTHDQEIPRQSHAATRGGFHGNSKKNNGNQYKQRLDHNSFSLQIICPLQSGLFGSIAHFATTTLETALALFLPLGTHAYYSISNRS